MFDVKMQNHTSNQSTDPVIFPFIRFPHPVFAALSSVCQCRCCSLAGGRARLQSAAGPAGTLLQLVSALADCSLSFPAFQLQSADCPECPEHREHCRLPSIQLRIVPQSLEGIVHVWHIASTGCRFVGPQFHPVQPLFPTANAVTWHFLCSSVPLLGHWVGPPSGNAFPLFVCCNIPFSLHPIPHMLPKTVQTPILCACCRVGLLLLLRFLTS